MFIYKPDVIAKCIKRYIKSNKIQPYIISFTLSFGYDPSVDMETPELLIAIATAKDVTSWIKETDAIQYIWNPAEYPIQEIAYKCVNSAIKINKSLTRKEYISSLKSLKEFIMNMICKDINHSCFAYVHDLDNHDIKSIISDNFTADQLHRLREEGVAICH